MWESNPPMSALQAVSNHQLEHMDQSGKRRIRTPSLLQPNWLATSLRTLRSPSRVRPRGFEPPHRALSGRCLNQTWLRAIKDPAGRNSAGSVRVEGFEPPHPKELGYSQPRLSNFAGHALAISRAGHTPYTHPDSNRE